MCIVCELQKRILPNISILKDYSTFLLLLPHPHLKKINLLTSLIFVNTTNLKISIFNDLGDRSDYLP